MRVFARISTSRGKEVNVGDNEELLITLKNGNKTFLTLLVMPPDEVMEHPLVTVVGARYEVACQLASDGKKVSENALISSDKDGYGLLSPTGERIKGNRA